MNRERLQQEVIAYWRKMAWEALASAKSELGANRLGFAINRAYYACFYIASAVLLQDQQKFVKHSGLRAAVHRHLVKEGRLDAKWGKIYDQLFESRQEADYQELAQLEPEEAAELNRQAEAFVAEMEKLLC